MATSSLPANETANQAATLPDARLLVCLPEMAADPQRDAIRHLADAFSGAALQVAGAPADTSGDGIFVVNYTSPRSQLGWVLAASDYTAAWALGQAHSPEAILILGSDASTLPPDTLRAMVDAIYRGADLVVPRYPVGAHDALVTSALLYPLTRALFTTDIRFPLPVDAALSRSMLQKLAGCAARVPASQGTDTLIWAVSEASIGGLRIQQVESPERRLPAAPDMDLNSLLGAVVGALFSDVEAKAAYWQRARTLPVRPATSPMPDGGSTSKGTLDEVQPMIESFRIALANLGEIWSIVLSPQSLLALKKLAAMPPESFRFDPSLWARTVYDFALAFHGRSLNRGHLLGAMTPLYLAWVASHLRASEDDAERSARWIELNAQAFEREKPYFVARWRWPDRFNP